MRDNRLTPAAILTLVILFAFLAGAIAYAIHAWRAMAGVQMSTLGWVFLALGVVITVLLGAGLMALVFYSSRHGMDR
ncbi:MAG: hypothetical protein BGN85_02980 [Alphaproteobacteria bacterium 64-11]|nr:hypothetical protein [Alphaproteobacteria bacterium]OJU08651.1 MAG: hypothetical protein BGN85_02980 [Alphaproteobacteria bacterium 64-11]